MIALVLRNREAIARACERYGVARLRAFGYAVTDQFDPKRSDVDFLVDFLPEVNDLLGNYLALKEDWRRSQAAASIWSCPTPSRTPTSRHRLSARPKDVYAA